MASYKFVLLHCLRLCVCITQIEHPEFAALEVKSNGLTQKARSEQKGTARRGSQEQVVKEGSWTKVIEYRDTPYPNTEYASGRLTSGGSPLGFAKFSDAMIRYICGDLYYLKFQSRNMGDEEKDMKIYVNLTRPFNASAPAMGLTARPYKTCRGKSFKSCIGKFQYSACQKGVWDTYCSGNLEVGDTTANNCSRWRFDMDESGKNFFSTGPCQDKPKTTRLGVTVWCKRIDKPEDFGKLPKDKLCPGVQAGENFIQLGKWRISAIEEEDSSSLSESQASSLSRHKRRTTRKTNFTKRRKEFQEEASLSISHQDSQMTAMLYESSGDEFPGPSDEYQTVWTYRPLNPPATTQTIKFGRRFIQIGNFRIGTAKQKSYMALTANDALSISADDADTAQAFQIDGTLTRTANMEPSDDFSTWIASRPLTEEPLFPEGVSFGDSFIQIDGWRIADVDGVHASIAHRSGKTAAIFYSDGTYIAGPRQSYNTWGKREPIFCTFNGRAYNIPACSPALHLFELRGQHYTHAWGSSTTWCGSTCDIFEVQSLVSDHCKNWNIATIMRLVVQESEQMVRWLSCGNQDIYVDEADYSTELYDEFCSTGTSTASPSMLVLSNAPTKGSTGSSGLTRPITNAPSNTNMNAGQCGHETASSGVGWWGVDLGKEYVVKSVSLYNRNENADVAARLSGIDVYVGNDWSTFDNNVRVATQITVPQNSPHKFLIMNPGRYLFVARPAGQLSLCAIQVIAFPLKIACPDGYTRTTSKLDGPTLQQTNWRRDSIGLCKTSCDLRTGCTSFEYKNDDGECKTYAGGQADLKTKELQVRGVMSCMKNQNSLADTNSNTSGCQTWTSNQQNSLSKNHKIDTGLSASSVAEVSIVGAKMNDSEAISIQRKRGRADTWIAGCWISGFSKLVEIIVSIENGRVQVQSGEQRNIQAVSQEESVRSMISQEITKTFESGQAGLSFILGVTVKVCPSASDLVTLKSTGTCVPAHAMGCASGTKTKLSCAEMCLAKQGCKSFSWTASMASNFELCPGTQAPAGHPACLLHAKTPTSTEDGDDGFQCFEMGQGYVEFADGICSGTDSEYSLSSLQSTNPGYNWYAHTFLANGVCNIQSVEACQAICKSVPGCQYFSTSLTQSCYACFVHKTCKHPDAQYSYKIYKITGTVALKRPPSNSSLPQSDLIDHSNGWNNLIDHPAGLMRRHEQM